MSEAERFAQHLSRLDGWAQTALECGSERGEDFDGLVFYAGGLRTYYADDLEIPFRTNAHFHRFAPVSGAGHLLIVRPGARPRLLRSVKSDYWSAAPGELDSWMRDGLDVENCEDVVAHFRSEVRTGRWAFIGGDADVAEAIGISRDSVDPTTIVAALDWSRATKTDYELTWLREAQRIAGKGHAQLRRAIESGATEFELHLAYLAATEHEETDLPYPNIIAWDEAGAVLHYQERRRAAPSPGKSFLVDAGACCRGYASDITRTYCVSQDDGTEPFRALLDGMESLHQRLVGEVAAKTNFVDLHRSAETVVAELLVDVGVVNVPPEEARSRGLVGAFFPHGLGHFLGLQVHDVGGLQANPYGGIAAPPDDCPNLRTTRTLEPDHVVTIEPGLYFISSLLEGVKASDAASAIDWDLVALLSPYGGIRIEDDVLVTADGRENLTRPFVPGHLDAPSVRETS